MVYSYELNEESSTTEIAEPSDRKLKKDEERYYKKWAINGEVYVPCGDSSSHLPPFQYMVNRNNEFGVYLVKKKVEIDGLIGFPDSAVDKVFNVIKTFWEREEIYREYRFLWKRGILMHGPAGSGKTSCINLISKFFIDNNGVVIYCQNPELTILGLDMLRKVEPIRPIMVIMEDLDAMLRYSEPEVLSLLDGELQLDNIVFVATTNYPEKLDPRITNRPSRFDNCVYVGMPNEDSRKLFLESKSKYIQTHPEEIDKWVKDTEGYSIAHIKELVVSVEILGNPYQETVDRLNKMREVSLNSDDHENGKLKIGFN